MLGGMHQRVAVLAAFTALAVGLAACGGDGGGGSAPAAASASPSSARPGVHNAVGTSPCGVLVAAGSVWVSLYGDSELLRLDPSTLALKGKAKTARGPCGIAYGAGALWVEDYVDNKLTRVDAQTLRVLHSYRTANSPLDVTFAGGAAWVTGGSDVV